MRKKLYVTLYENRPAGEPPTEEQLAGFRLVAQRAIDASLELADELETA